MPDGIDLSVRCTDIMRTDIELEHILVEVVAG